MAVEAGGSVHTAAYVPAVLLERLEAMAAVDRTPLATLVRQLIGSSMRGELGLRVVDLPTGDGSPLRRVDVVVPPEWIDLLTVGARLLGCSRSALISALLERAVGDGTEAA